MRVEQTGMKMNREHHCVQRITWLSRACLAICSRLRQLLVGMDAAYACVQDWVTFINRRTRGRNKGWGTVFI